MKAIYVILIQIVFVATAWSQATKVIYTCVMHPEVKMDKPGNCPKCGMTLIKKIIKVPAQKHVDNQKPAIKEPAQKEPGNLNKQVPDRKQEEVKADEFKADEFIGSKVNMLPGKTVVYHLYVTDTTVNFTGKTKHAYAINGSIPAPALVFTEGDTAEIYLHNM